MLPSFPKFSLAAVVLVALCSAPMPLPPAQGTTGSGQDLTACDIDIRPAPPRGRGEAQVYWGEAGGGHAGAKATIYVIMDGVLLFGLGNATQELPLKAGKANEVTWWWDDAKKLVHVKVDNKDETVGYKPIEVDTDDYTGAFDRLGTLKDATWEYVRRGVADKKRIRVTMKNYGIEAAFTITDA